MKKIILLILVGLSPLACADDLFHTGQCTTGSCPFSLGAKKELPFGISTSCSASGGSRSHCPICRKYAAISGNIPEMEACVRQIKSIPGWNSYPGLFNAVTQLDIAISYASRGARGE